MSWYSRAQQEEGGDQDILEDSVSEFMSTLEDVPESVPLPKVVPELKAMPTGDSIKKKMSFEDYSTRKWVNFYLKKSASPFWSLGPRDALEFALNCLDRDNSFRAKMSFEDRRQAAIDLAKRFVATTWPDRDSLDWEQIYPPRQVP